MMPLPTTPSWTPTEEEWSRPDNVFRIMVRENGYKLDSDRRVGYLPSAAARLRSRTLSHSTPPTVFLPPMDAPGSGESAWLFQPVDIAMLNAHVVFDCLVGDMTEADRRAKHEASAYYDHQRRGLYTKETADSILRRALEAIDFRRDFDGL